jgi:hypothetical protein
MVHKGAVYISTNLELDKEFFWAYMTNYAHLGEMKQI